MRQIGGKIGEPLERFLEPAKHGVEGDDQFGEFAGHIVFGDALAQPAGGNPPGSPGNGAYRKQAAAGDQQADDGGEQRGRQHRQPEIAAQLVEEIGVMTNVAGDDDACLLSPPGMERAAHRPVFIPGDRQAQRRFADGGGSLGQRPRLAGVGPGEKWPFLAVDRNDHSVLADQRVAEARREGRCGVFVSPDMAGQFQLSQQFVRVELGHVSVGRAAQVDAERGENQRGQQCERQRQAQRDRLAPFAHDQRISIT